MNRIAHPALVYATMLVFLAYTVSACSSTSEATKELEKYDGYDYADEASFNRPYEETYRATIGALEGMRFTITLSDESSGEIRAEDGRSELRPEDERVEQMSGSEDLALLAVLAAIMLAIVLFFVGGTSGSGDDSADESETEASPEKTYAYVMTLQVRPEGPETTRVTVGVSRFDYEDAELVGSKDLENKYLNHSLFDRIEEQLMLTGAQPGVR